MNIISISGIVQKDPKFEIRNGYKISKFVLMVPKKRPNKERYYFFDCTAFGEVAEFVKNYVKKGKIVAAYGECQINKYIKDGTEHKSIEVIVDRAEFEFPASVEEKVLRAEEKARKQSEKVASEKEAEEFKVAQSKKNDIKKEMDINDECPF